MDGLRNSPRAILFLDFDGVVQTPALEDWREMEHCQGLWGLLQALPELEIVVTSTHREGRDLPSLRAMLPDGISPRVVGATRVTPLGRADGGRQAEVEEWLLQHGGPVNWAAVDDENHLYRPGCRNLVLTNKYVGWDVATTEAVLRILRKDAGHAPISTGTREAPNIKSASQRCRPSMNVISFSTCESTGSGGQGRRPFSAALVNHSSKYATRELSGDQGSGLWDTACKLVISMNTTCTGFFRRP
jgi:hypothetical protein